MKLEIDADERIAGEIDLNRLEEYMKDFHLDLEGAILSSISIEKNLLNWKNEYIVKVVFAEIDWTAVLMNFKHRKNDKMQFKICSIKFEDKVEYERYAKSPDFSRVILKEIRKSGTGYIVINSFNPNPEHNIDMWIAKSTYPYPESNWVDVLH